MAMDLREAISIQLKEIMRKAPPSDPFQRGYAEALRHTWELAGLPHTPEFIAVSAMRHTFADE